jgi:hypothetical protein
MLLLQHFEEKVCIWKIIGLDRLGPCCASVYPDHPTTSGYQDILAAAIGWQITPLMVQHVSMWFNCINATGFNAMLQPHWCPASIFEGDREKAGESCRMNWVSLKIVISDHLRVKRWRSKMLVAHSCPTGTNLKKKTGFRLLWSQTKFNLKRHAPATAPQT